MSDRQGKESSKYPDSGAVLGGEQAGCSTPPSPVKVSELSNQVNTLSNNLEYLDKAISGLTQKLSPLLSPNKPADAKTLGQTSMQTDVGKLLQTYNQRLVLLTDAIHDLACRVEV